MARAATREATYRALHELAIAIGGVVEPATLARIVVEYAQRLLPADHAAFFEVVDGGDRLRILRWGDLPEVEVGPGPSATWQAFVDGAPVLRNGTRGTTNRALLVELGAVGRLAGPLIHDGATLGVISLVARRRFDAADRRLLAQVLAQVAPRFAAVKLSVERARRNQELAALHELAVRIGGAATPEEVARAAVRTATDLLGDSATLRLCDPDTGELTVLYDTALELPYPYRPPAGGVARVAFGTGLPTVKQARDTEGGYSVAAVPLISGDHPIGTLGVRADGGGDYSPEAVRLLELIAAQVAPALAAARNAAERERTSRTLSFLHTLAVSSGGILDPAQLADRVAHAAAELIGCDAGGVVWLTPGGELVLIADTGVDVRVAPPPSLERGILGRAFNERRAIRADDYAGMFGSPRLPDITIGSALAVPLIVGERAIGALGVRSAGPRTFSTRDERDLTLLAAQLAPAFEAAGLHAVVADALRAAGRREQEQAAAAELGAAALAGVPNDELVKRTEALVAAVLGAPARVVRHGGPAAGAGITVPIGDDGRSLVVDLADAADADARFVRAMAQVLGDALARRAAEVELRRSRRELQAVLDHAGVLLFALDSAGRVLMMEGRSARRLGAESARLRGTSIFDRVEPGSDVERGLREALAGRPATYTASVNGRELDVVVHPVVEADGSVNGVIGVATDVTDLRLAELARRENEAKSRFLAAMSHEFRTPLNAVLGFSQLMVSDPQGNLTERQRRYLDNIEQSGRHLLALVNDILDISRVAAGQMTVEAVPVVIAESLADVINRVRPLADEKRLRLALVAPGDLVAVADGRRFEQVAFNLLGNAIKFTPVDGEVVVTARAAGDWVEVEVADNGIGIPPEDLSRIFEEFTQVETAMTRAHDGTGLGLALSRRLAELMGGGIEVTSELGRGSRFTLRLPAARERSEAASARISS